MLPWSAVFQRTLIVVMIASTGLACGDGDSDARRALDAGIDAGAPDASLEDTSNDGSLDDPDTSTDDTGGERDAEVDGGVDPEEPDTPGAVDCAPLPESGGTIVEVDPSMAAQLPQLVRQAQANTTFVLAAGTYAIADTLHVRAEGVTLRSANNDAESVVIDGGYNVNSLLLIQASEVTVAHLTLTRALHHPIHVSPGGGDAPETITGTRIYGVRIVDGAQQFIKINPNGARSAFVDDGLVACSYFELTDAGRPRVDRSGTGCYTGGVDAHAARGWVVRDNHFKDIYCAGEGLAEHAVHFWSASRDTVVERNLIENCARGVGFGLLQSGGDRAYADDPYPQVSGYMGHIDGVVRNNVIVADIDYYDTGIELAQAHGARVIHNTIFDADAANRFSSIDYRFPNSSVEIRNNLVGRITRRNEAVGEVDHNLEGIGAELFEDATGRNFHLRASASDAIDQGVELEEAGLDIDGEPRDRGTAPDLGADEH
ncbi:hypothetical protein DV096_14390 [Bradymonadaceae bacterium TMQ3]|nr:hypothetical protein DV096_14390 [Bradymonadaceae bacterium TMQ3]TXC74890.1 hypothetical protein FRC91_15175 [Bradymonadales bacterium TMQ1]